MALRVIGAGLGRTGTNSLKLALQQLLGGPCYHMFEVSARTDHTAVWHAAVRGEPVDWGRLLSEFAATVDWPACAFWRELHEANPDAFILLSTRESAQAWWESMQATIIAILSRPDPPDEPENAERRAMIRELLRVRFSRGWRDRETAIGAYEAHNAEVREAVGRGRLIDWRPGDGWEPICGALDLPVPQAPFPHVNTTADFRASVKLDQE
ncbi:MAG: sulfotransferase family protein [Actinomycetota bacterium]|nr:sulfotransferase family protein [Actinomycetota bacterium]